MVKVIKVVTFTTEAIFLIETKHIEQLSVIENGPVILRKNSRVSRVIPTSPAIGEMDSSLMCVILYLN
jgi:hypothetical protein